MRTLVWLRLVAGSDSENRELHRANAILKTASAFCASMPF